MSDFDRQRAFLETTEHTRKTSFSPKDGYEFAGGLVTVQDSLDQWPYVFGVLGETVGSSPLKFVTYCEGDVDVYTFATKADRDDYATLYGQSDEDYAEELAMAAGHDIPGKVLLSLLQQQGTVDPDEVSINDLINLYQGEFDSDKDYAMFIADQNNIPDPADLRDINGHIFPYASFYKLVYADMALSMRCDGEFNEDSGHYFRNEG